MHSVVAISGWQTLGMSTLEPEEIVREDLAEGKTGQEIAVHLTSEGVRPIAAIKALRSEAGIPLGEGKILIDRTLSPEQQAANERLRDVAEETLRLVQAIDEAPCVGSRSDCSAKVEAFVIYLIDPGEGLHVVAPLIMDATCRKHRKAVLDRARRSTLGWLEPGVVPLNQVGDLLDWFYGASGLSIGPRAISVTTSSART